MQEFAQPIRTKDAAVLIGENSVKQFLRVMDREGIEPAVQVPGIRGAKFWNRSDLARLIPSGIPSSPSSVAPASTGDGALRRSGKELA